MAKLTRRSLLALLPVSVAAMFVRPTPTKVHIRELKSPYFTDESRWIEVAVNDKRYVVELRGEA